MWVRQAAPGPDRVEQARWCAGSVSTFHLTGTRALRTVPSETSLSGASVLPGRKQMTKNDNEKE